MADDRTCSKCGKKFEHPCRLKAHLLRKTPCERIVQNIVGGFKPHRCPACNREFTTKEAKYRHKRETCKANGTDDASKLRNDLNLLENKVALLLRQQPQTTNNIVVAGPVVTNNSNVDNSRKVLTNNVLNNSNSLSISQQAERITNYTPAQIPPPGWPAKWPMPSVDPRPFFAPSCAVELSELRQAAARLDAADTAACHKGEPRAVSALLMEVLRQLHEDPEQRNIYLNPDRGDQALVFVPRKWSLKPLEEATHHIFKQVVKELADLPMQGNPKEQDLAAGVKNGFEKKPQAVVQTSNSAMTAHLKNMESLLRAKQGPGQHAQMLEDSWTAGDEPPRLFCHEAFGHIKLESTLYTMEIDAGVNDAKDVVEERYADQARRAVYSLARQVLRWKAKNQTAVQVTDNKALIYTYGGWEEKPAAEVGEKLFRRFAGVTIEYVEGVVATPLKPLGRYIAQHIDELAAEERKSLTLLGQYSQQAERVCATSTNPEFAKLKNLLHSATIPSSSDEKKEEASDTKAADILDELFG